jgi:predicted glycoside hydrolase/deacetylase ChbG (UPF0249 family)
MKLFFSLFLAACLGNILFASGQQKQAIRLIVRGDDMGITHATNVACIQCYKKGWMKSTEVIVLSPWFPEAVKLLKENPGLDAGVHLALTSEWENIKWRPLTYCPDLCDADGYFFPVIWPGRYYDSSSTLLGHQWKLNEVVAELKEQIKIAKQNIPQLTHVSYHMGCNDMDPRVQPLIDSLAKSFGLYVDMSEVKPVSYQGSHRTSEEKIKSFEAMLKGLKPGNYLFVDHPSLDNKEMQAVYMKGYKDVAYDRQGVTDLFTSKYVKKLISRLKIQIISYATVKITE